MDRPTASSAAEAEYGRIAAALAPTGVSTGRMMGMPTLYVDGKAFAGLYGDAMVFKLFHGAHAAAMALSGAVLFDPSGRGRPMKAWIQVPLEQAPRWADLAAQALAAAQESAG